MEAMRRELIAQTSDPKRYADYTLVQVGKDAVTSAGQMLTQGQVTLADPDTYTMRGQDYRAVYSLKAQAHIMVPAKQLSALEPPQAKGGP